MASKSRTQRGKGGGKSARRAERKSAGRASSVPERHDPRKSGNGRSRSKALVILLGVSLLLVVGFLSWHLLAWKPQVFVPEVLDDLDPQLRAYVEQNIAWTREAPRDPARQASLGKVYAANELWRAALGCFQNVARLDPDEPLAEYYQAVALRKLGETDACTAHLRKVAKRFPNFAPGQHRLGDSLLETGALDEAEPAFRRVIQLEPSAPHGYVGLADVKMRRGEHADAAKLLEKALGFDPRDRMTRYMLGRAYIRLGRKAEAERHLKMGTMSEKRILPDAWLRTFEGHAKGMARQATFATKLIMAGAPARGVTVLEEALRWHPDSVGAMNNLAIGYAQTKQYDKALELLHRAKELDASYFKTYTNLAACLMDLGRTIEALGFVDQVVRLVPRNSKAHLTRGRVLAKLGQYPAALEALRTAGQFNAQDASIRLETGNVYMLMGDLAKARESFEVAEDLDPADVSPYLRKCEVYVRLGRIDEAALALSIARKVAPGHPRVKAMTEWLDRQRN